MIDYVEIFQTHTVTFCQSSGLGIGTHVEADQRRIRRCCQQHVGLGDTANARQQYADLDIVGRDIVECGDDRFDRTLHIALDNHRIFHRPRGGQIIKQIFKIWRDLRRANLGRLFLTIQSHFAGTRFVFNDGQNVPCRWNTGQTKHFDWGCRASLGYLLSLFVDQSTNLAALCADDEYVTTLQRSALHKHSCDSTAPLIELRLDHNGFRRAVWIGFQLHELSLQGKLFKQIIKASLLQR